MKKMQCINVVLGAAGVALGAFGAHALGPIIESNSRQETWDTAMLYYWIHLLAFAALTFGRDFEAARFRWIRRTGATWLASTFLFSGSLIALSLGAPQGMGAITPVGGVGFIVGWLMLIPTCNGLASGARE